MTTTTSTKLIGSLANLAATIPLLVAIRDTALSFVTVRGDSMEPTLKNGDVVLVRRRDFPAFLEKDDVQKRVDRNDWMQGIAMTNLTTSPGEIVVVRNPLLLHAGGATQDRFYIKRVVGVGGQWLIHPGVNNAFRLEELPSYSVFVQGDNVDHSIDSRLLGPISRNLVVGKAECIVWPPSRWKVLTREDARGQIRAVWSRYDEEEDDGDNSNN